MENDGTSYRIKYLYGQSLVELGIVIILFFIFVLAIIEFSIYFYFLSTLNAASNDGARYAIAANNILNCDGIHNATSSRIAQLSAPDTITIEYNVSGSIFHCPLSEGTSGFSTGDTITVSVTATYNPIILLFNFLQGQYSSTSSRSILLNIPIP